MDRFCWFDGVSLRVGPQSAGALPGPACYGRGGPLTITDLNVLLGRLPEQQFPFPLDTQAARLRLDELFQQVKAARLSVASPLELASGLRKIANQQMAEAVRTISIAQGADPRTHTLVGFGGAAGQHICEIAELLGMRRVIDTPDAGLLLSALGMGLAPLRRDRTIPIYEMLDDLDLLQIEKQSSLAQSELTQDWFSATESRDTHSVLVQRWLQLRYQGTDVALPIEWSVNSDSEATHGTLAGRFAEEHRRRFGYVRPERRIEVVSLRLEVLRPSDQMLPPSSVPEVMTKSCSEGAFQCTMFTQQSECVVPAYRRSEIPAGTLVDGPAIILSDGSTLAIDTGWQACELTDGSLLLEQSTEQITDRTSFASQQASHVHSHAIASEPAQLLDDPVMHAVFAQRLAAIATQMGLVLQQTALSVNVKQRRDFSCAVFDSQGRMLASAPHVPVHLGAMGTTVRAVMQRYPKLQPGESVVTNDPYEGGSHLPDVTVISGVYEPGNDVPCMFVANRAHHADIGGMTPGSMCVTATRLEQEGAIIRPLLLRPDDYTPNSSRCEMSCVPASGRLEM